eukprot:234402_1
MSATTSIFIVIIHHIYSLLSEEINCDNDWSASTCYRKEISCSTNSSICSINCNGEGSCNGAILNCNTNTNRECNINCLGKYSCSGATTESSIICPSNANCNIYCNGDYSCDEIEINCPQTSNCTLYGNGEHSLPNAHVRCPIRGHCSINCNNILSCYDGIYNGWNATQFTINCENNKNACKNMHVACPKAIDNIKRCTINGDQGTVHDEINLYAINSWDDIDLSEFVGKTGPGSDTHKPWMHCGEDFRSTCVISHSAWNCEDNTSVCYRDGIYPFPTPIPTEAPSTPPINSVEPWYAIVGIIIGIFFFCLFVILGWICCVKQQQKEKTKYETLDQAPDPDADIMQKEHQHMYRTEIPNTKNRKSMDIVTKDGLHIVNDYSDASKLGGLLPISEEKTETLSSKSHVIEEKKQNNKNSGNRNTGVSVIEDQNDELNVTETDKLIETNAEQTGVTVVEEGSNVAQNKTRESNVITK